MPKYYIEVRKCTVSDCMEHTNQGNEGCTTVNLNKHGNGYMEIGALNKEKAIALANHLIDIHKACNTDIQNG